MTAGYKSFGSYTPLYIEAKRGLSSFVPEIKRYRPAFYVLNALADCASQVGTCYPGLTALANATQYAPETVKRAINDLGALDYVRAHMLRDVVRAKNQFTYQLSPWVLYIAPDYIEAAMSLWESANVKTILINVEEPTTDNQQQNHLQNHLNNHPQEPESRTNNNNHPHKDSFKGKDKSKKRKNGASSAPDDIQQESHDNSAKRESDLSEFLQPLPYDQEAAAKSFVTFGTTAPQARLAVKTYGPEAVKSAIVYVANQQNVKNPVGLVMHLLGKGWTFKQEETEPANPYTNGKFADFIES